MRREFRDVVHMPKMGCQLGPLPPEYIFACFIYSIYQYILRVFMAGTVEPFPNRVILNLSAEV